MDALTLLQQVAQRYPDTLALVDAEVSLTYTQLLDQVGEECRRLECEQHLMPGQCYAVPVSQDAAYVIRQLAVHCLGAVSILYTTGSTSQPKGVRLPWSAALADTENLVEAQHFAHPLKFVICGPLHHFGCWSKILPTLMVGGTLQILPGLKDQEQLLEALGSAPRTATFLVPSAIRMLLQFSSDRLKAIASHIDFIETGGAPSATPDMERLRQVLPKTRLYNTYAGTETGVVCTYPYHLSSPDVDPATEPCLVGCSGPAMRHAQVSLDVEGHIVVRGAMIMQGYLDQPDVTEVVTTDIGRLDERGYLYLTGRDSDFINVGGLKVSPVEVEEAAASFPGLVDCICIPASHPLMGQVPRLLVVMAPGVPYDRHSLILHLKSRLDSYKLPLLYQQVEEIRKTFNGKKDRKYVYLSSSKSASGL